MRSRVHQAESMCDLQQAMLQPRPTTHRAYRFFTSQNNKCRSAFTQRHSQQYSRRSTCRAAAAAEHDSVELPTELKKIVTNFSMVGHLPIRAISKKHLRSESYSIGPYLHAACSLEGYVTLSLTLNISRGRISSKLSPM